MYQNFETIDSYQIAKGLIARISRVHEQLSKPSDPKSDLIPVAETEYVVATYHVTGLNTVNYGSTLKTAEHFSDEDEAMSYYLSLIDPEEFGQNQLCQKSYPHWIPERSYKAPEPIKSTDFQ